MKKILRYIKNRLKHSNQQLKVKKQISETQKLRSDHLSDTSRWSKDDVFYSDWNERSRLMGELVKPGARLIEFGAGKAYLRDSLPESVKYTPSDLVKREEDFLVCDLNQEIELDLGNYDTIIFCGVLEYVYDIQKLFSQFPENVQNIILSYACVDTCSLNRLANGWLSDYTQMELEEIFKGYGYQIQEKKEWKQQNIYFLERKKLI